MYVNMHIMCVQCTFIYMCYIYTYIVYFFRKNNKESFSDKMIDLKYIFNLDLKLHRKKNVVHLIFRNFPAEMLV